MARNTKDRIQKDSEEQEEMTVAMLRFKGGSQSLRKGFETVSQALAALGQPTVVHHRRLSAIAASPAEIHEAPAAANPDGVDSSDEAGGSIAAESEESIQRGSAAGARRYKKPSFLSDLNLTPAEGVAWKNYSEQKNPQGANQQYLIAAAWLTRHGGHEIFADDHLFTCFRAMGWNELKDFMQPVRQMKKKQSYFETIARGQWKLPPLGLDTTEGIANKAE